MSPPEHNTRVPAGGSATRPAPGPARWRASGWDYLLIVCWLGVLAAAGFTVLALSPVAGTFSLPVTDVLAFAVSVLPVWMYLTVGESRAAQAAWGKRRAGLRVVRADGGRAGWGRIAVRTGIKLLPWQLAHLAVARLMLGVDAPVTIGVTYALAVVIPLVSIGMAWRDPLHRALHDRVARTRVVAGS